MTDTFYVIKDDNYSFHHSSLSDAHMFAEHGDLIIEITNDGSVMGKRDHWYVNRDYSIKYLRIKE